MNILITGFEPFGGAAENPSWEAVRLLPKAVDGVPLVKLRLPVIYETAGRLAVQAAREARAALVVCTGVASGRKHITPELVALNWRMASIADNAGVSYHGERIAPGAPAALMTPLPVVRMVQQLQEKGTPAAVSTTAGSYVCNDVYWHVLCGAQALGYKGLFVHVPDTQQLSSAEAARALETILRCALSEKSA